jgi:TorA maturation chaperone TorD
MTVVSRNGVFCSNYVEAPLAFEAPLALERESMNTSTENSVSVLLAGRAGVYRILQNLLGNEPNEETFQQLESTITRDIFSLFATDEGEYKQALDALLAEAAVCRSGGTEALERLRNGFTALFVGPGKVEANPWESFYLSRDNTLFQSITLEVRKAYVAQGLLPQAYPNVADDHVALELDFMARLAEKLEDAFEANDSQKANDCLSASESFVREHLINWIPTFAEVLGNARHSCFYRETGNVLAAFLPIDLQALGEVREVMKGASGQIR